MNRTVTFDMQRIEEAIYRAFRASYEQIKVDYEEPEIPDEDLDLQEEIVREVIENYRNGHSIQEVADEIIDSIVARLLIDSEIGAQQITFLKTAIRRGCRRGQASCSLLIKSLLEKLNRHTGRISNGDSIYRAKAAAVPTPPTHQIFIGGVAA